MVGKGARDIGPPPCVAHAAFIAEAVDTAITGARHTLGQLRMRDRYLVIEATFPPRGQVGGLEVLDQEPIIDPSCDLSHLLTGYPEEVPSGPGLSAATGAAYPGIVA
jgi:hypothetical protein